MSAAAAQTQMQPRHTDGYIRIPATLIENQWALTPAELRLALIVLRRNSGHAPDDPRTAPATIWESWTGQSARHRKNAMRGLARKGLRIDGKGDKAKVWFDPKDWRSYVHTARTAKIRTAGRKETAVDPRPGAKISPQCRERGCAVLYGETELSCSTAPQNGKPVSQTPLLQIVPLPSESSPSQNQSTPAVAPRNGKPVSQKSAPLAQAWAATLVALQAFFPILGVAFLVQLLAAIKTVFGAAVFTDEELSAAVYMAGHQNHGKQKRPGLFLLTVPEALEAIQAGRLKKPKPPEEPRDIAADIGAGLLKAAEALRGRGGDFPRLAELLDGLRARVAAAAPDDLYAVLDAMEPETADIQSQIVAAAEATFTRAQQSDVAAAVDKAMRPYVKGDRSSPGMVVELRTKFNVRAVLEAIDVPAVTLW